jgi:hypothetical protein
MTKAGARVVLEAAQQAHSSDPETFAPVARFFGVDVEARLQDESLLERLVYVEY